MPKPQYDYKVRHGGGLQNNFKLLGFQGHLREILNQFELINHSSKFIL